jgi:long-chain fatty acid transport protein
MLQTSVKAVLLLFALIACMRGYSSADEFHYNNFLIGDRASGMGGAYAGVSDDPSGLYYNPAGIVYTTGRNLSASVNAFYTLTKKYDNVIGGNGWERKATSLLPNFFGIIQPIGDFKFGFSYAVPDSIKEDQDQTFTGTALGSPADLYVINFNNEDNTYLIGPSLAYEVNSKMSAGMTLYLYHRSSQTTLNQFIHLQDGRFEWTNQYIERVERGYKPIVGLMYTPAEKLSLGVSLSKTFVYSSSLNSQRTFKDANAPTPNDYTRDVVDISAKRKFPYELRMGAAYFPSSSLLLTADAIYYTSVHDETFGNRVSVLNGAVGAEYYFSRNWAMRGGLFTDLANTPELDPAKSDQPEKIDLYGASLGVSHFTRNTSVTLGGSASYGTGKAQIVSNSTTMQNAEIFGWTIFLSSSYSY